MPSYPLYPIRQGPNSLVLGHASYERPAQPTVTGERHRMIIAFAIQLTMARKEVVLFANGYDANK